MQVVLNVKGSFRTTGSGHNREVVALYRWPLVQVPLYMTSQVNYNVQTLLFFSYAACTIYIGTITDSVMHGRNKGSM